METDDIHWLLRDAGGEAFALALLPYGYGEVHSVHPPAVVVCPPVEFNTMIDDLRTGVTIIDYNYEPIPAVEWETLQAFGVPLLRVVTTDDGMIFLEIR